jgi:hypothetical protein
MLESENVRTLELLLDLYDNAVDRADEILPGSLQHDLGSFAWQKHVEVTIHALACMVSVLHDAFLQTLLAGFAS